MRRLIVLAVMLGGCTFATRPMLLNFTRSGPPTKTGWTKVVTNSFTLATDFSPGTAQEAAQDIAGELAGIEAAFGNTQPRFETELDVVVYSNGIDFEDRFGRNIMGVTRPEPRRNRHFVYLWGRPTRWVHHNMVGQSESSGSILRQALAHVVLARQISITVLPKWLMYGMGGYVENFAWSEDGKSIELGAVNTDKLLYYRNDRSIGFTDVTEPQHDHPGQEEAYRYAFEGYCWALVFTAVNTHPQGLGKYLAAVANGEPADPTMIFDGATPEVIDQEVEQFILRGRFSLRTVPVDSHPLAATVSAISDEELKHFSPPPR